MALTKAVNARLNTGEKAEGADIVSDRWEPKESANDLLADFLLYPYDEVKAVNEFLIKDFRYNQCEPSGTLPIEIFHKWVHEPDQHFPYNGWVQALFDPDGLSKRKHQFNQKTGNRYNVPERVYRPGTLDFFLFHGEQLHEEPFACIAFERIEELKKIIVECVPYEWNLENWNLPPLSDQKYWSQFIDYSDNGYTKKWDPERGGMIQNCWHIPLRTLADIATFTLIGIEDPDTEHRKNTIQRLEETRLEYIKSKAEGRRIIL